MKKNLLYIIVILEIVLFSHDLWCEVVIRNIYQDRDTISFGMCKVGEELGTEFEISNLTDENYKLLDVDPSFYLGTPRDVATNHYEEFSLRDISLPVQIPAHTTLSLKIVYAARPEISIYQAGMKTALLKIGIIPESLQAPPSQDDFVAYKEFILTAKKSIAGLDFYDNEINLDSVCINPYNPIEFQTYMQNNSRSVVTIAEEGFSSRTDSCLETELFRTDTDSSVYFSSILQQKIRSFRYYPVNQGWDTASYSVKYLLEGDTGTASLRVTAFAANQKIVLTEAVGCELSGDTIEVGDVRIGDSVAVPVLLKNFGNLNFGVLSQKMLSSESEAEEPAFTIVDDFLQAGKNLMPGETDTMKIAFKPNRQGTILVRCVIESDIANRRIRNVNNASRKVVFYLKACGTASILTLSTDTLDFGSMVISEECPVVLDTFITLYNSGNRILKITQAEIIPVAGMPYVFDNAEFSIDAGKSVKFPVSFHSSNLPSGMEYTGKIIFHSNSLGGGQTSEVYLLATTLPSRYIDVGLPDRISAKTGRIISVPVYADKNKLTVANKFSCYLEYDKSILQYADYVNYGTASAKAWNIRVTDADENSVFLEIANDNNVEFTASDTLIILNFNTFLSEKYYSPIVIRDVKIGNSACDQIFKYDLTNSNTVFTIDSVCGLDYKTLPKKGEGTFAVKSIYPNPCRNFVDIQFENLYSCLLKLEIINALGITEEILIDGFAEKGVHNVSFDTGRLIAGSYHCRLSAGNIVKYGHFKVLK